MTRAGGSTTRRRTGPNSPKGFGKTAYQFFEKELEPLGYTVRAEIVSYPDGMLGDVGLFIRW